MICPKCAAQIPDDATSCIVCGAVIESSPAQALAPSAPVAPVAPVEIDMGKHAANQWLRLVNYFIDNIGAWIFGAIVNSFLLAAPFSSMRTPEDIEANIGAFIGIIVLSFLTYAIYYIFFESIWQRTPGKWASGTKVVMLDGSKPSFWRIVGRSFARYIPFEPFSYLFGKHPYGWHDALTKTTVVSAAYIPDDVKSINVHDKGRSSVWIWVLAAVAILLPILLILGVLSSVVLASLNSARAAGNEAAIKSNLANVRYQAELYYDTVGSYEGVCESDQIASIKAVIDLKKAVFSCNDSKDEWAAAAPISKGMTWCSDSTGYSGNRVGDLVDSTACLDELSKGEVKWFTYTSPVDGFTVDFPREPVFNQEKDIPLGIGDETMDQTFYEAEDETNYYGVVKVEYSISLADSDTYELLAAMVDGSVKSSPVNKLVSSKNTTYMGDPAIDFIIAIGSEGFLRGRYIYSDDHSVYSLLMSYQTENADEANYKRFVESFRK
jgi:uncharacterized RDD family membrane protein YckC